MAQLSDLSMELLDGFILPHLSWNDLLRFRRVCIHFKIITDAHIQSNPEIAPEIEISEENTDKSLAAFLHLGIPTRKIFINNPSGHEYFDKLNMMTFNNFLESYGPTLKSLRLKQFSFSPRFNEWTFLSSLPTLKVFKADFIACGRACTSGEYSTIKRHIKRGRRDTRINGLYFPPNFNNLEIIKIGQTHPMVHNLGNIHTRVPLILNMCKNLEYISFPANLHYSENVYIPVYRVFRESEHVLIQMMKVFSTSLGTNGRRPIKSIDFENYHVDERFRSHPAHHQVSREFLILCKKCIEYGVKLLNVHPSWFEKRPKMRDRSLKSFDIGFPVVSMVYFDPCVFKLNMPNLRKIDIRKTSPQGYSIIGLKGRLQWPSLKIVNINVDLGSEAQIERKKVIWLFDLFFKNVVRDQLTEISLSFETKLKVLAPNTEDIVKSCRNLKKLRISHWPGPHKELTKFWSGLPALEELTLEGCSGITNKAFVGDDFGNPMFLKLKNLKKLTLKGLDQMPGITDTFFSLVLARMKLTHLILLSETPLINITKVGLGVLLKGPEFSASIESFPFYGWSIAGLTAEQFQKLGKQFRSSQMM